MSTPAVSDNNTPYFQATIPGVTQVLNYTNSAADLPQPFASGTTIVEVFCTTDAWILVKESTDSSNAAAISSGSAGSCVFCPGGIVRFIGLPVKRGVLYTMSVVRNTSSGTIYTSEGL